MADIIVYPDVESLAEDIPYRFFVNMKKNSNFRTSFKESYVYKIGDKKGLVTISGPEPEVSVAELDIKLTGEQMWEKAQAYVPKLRSRMDPFEAMFSGMRM